MPTLIRRLTNAENDYYHARTIHVLRAFPPIRPIDIRIVVNVIMLRAQIKTRTRR